MISKKSSRRKDGRSSIKRLINYILGVTKTTNGEKDHEKVLYSRFKNCHSDDPDLVLKEMMATQAMNTRATSDKTYHLIVSFRAGERLTETQLNDIEDEFCNALGFGDHQRMSAVHQNTDNLHLHIVINKIHPETFVLHEPYRDYRTRDEVCRRLEHRYGLQPDRGRQQRETASPSAKTGDMEAHSGVESFQLWVKGEPATVLHACLASTDASWEAMHRNLAKYDLHIRKRGNGFVIADRTRKLFVKASAISREFSKANIEKRLGAFQEPRAGIKEMKADKTYTAKPLHRDDDREKLFQEYQDERKKTKQAKKLLLDNLKRDERERFEAIKDQFAAKRQKVKEDISLGNKAKRPLYSILKMERLKAMAELKADIRKRRTEIHDRNRLLTWQNFLISEAEKGNDVALKVLRSSSKHKEKGAGKNILQGLSGHEDHTIFKGYKYVIHKNGDITYFFQSGGSFRDEGRRIRMISEEGHGIEAAIKMAQAKFGSCLDIKGDTAFTDKVLDVVVKKGIKITFSNKELEAKRQARLLIKKSKGQGRESEIERAFITP